MGVQLTSRDKRGITRAWGGETQIAIVNVPNGVASSQTNPLGDGSILPLLLGKNLLDLERLVGRLCFIQEGRVSITGAVTEGKRAAGNSIAPQ